MTSNDFNCARTVISNHEELEMTGEVRRRDSKSNELVFFTIPPKFIGVLSVFFLSVFFLSVFFGVLSVSIRGIICILILSGDGKCIFKYIDLKMRGNDEVNKIP